MLFNVIYSITEAGGLIVNANPEMQKILLRVVIVQVVINLFPE